MFRAKNGIIVRRGLFGPDLTLGNLRMGDLIAVCNLIENMKAAYVKSNSEIEEFSAFIDHNALFPQKHVYEMHKWLCENTDYISMYPPENEIHITWPTGTDQTYPNMINLWNIRKDVKERKQNVFDVEDLVHFQNCETINKNSPLIVVAPLMDAPYNAHRNWSLNLTQQILDFFDEQDKQNIFEKIIISKEPIDGLDLRPDWLYSHNFNNNLYYCQESNIYIGGDTGFSHFVGASDNPWDDGQTHISVRYNQKRYYLYSKETYGTTYPFHWKTHGKIIEFDKEGIDINTELADFNEYFKSK